MTIPNCTANTTVITNIGTTPQERGMTADQFKAKFDEAPTNIKNDLNNNIIPGINAHLADLVTDDRGVHGFEAESGEFTPVIAGSVTPGNHTYATQKGCYLKQGSHVHCDIRIELVAKDPSISGTLSITGLPFVAKTAGRTYSSSVAQFSNIVLSDGYTFVGGLLWGLSAAIQLSQCGNNKQVNTLSATSITNTSAFIMSIDYGV